MNRSFEAHPPAFDPISPSGAAGVGLPPAGDPRGEDCNGESSANEPGCWATEQLVALILLNTTQGFPYPVC